MWLSSAMRVDQLEWLELTWDQEQEIHVTFNDGENDSAVGRSCYIVSSGCCQGE